MRKYLVLMFIAILALAVSGCLFQPAPTPPPTKAILTGQVIVPQGAVRQVGGQALPGATVNVIDPVTGNIVATTTTDADGNYQVEVPPGGPYIIEAVKGNLKVLDVSPQVEVGQTYDLGTADATSTAVALVFQAKVEAGEDPAQINLDEILEDPKIGNLIEAVEEALAAGEDPTTAPEVTQVVEVIVTPPAPAPAPPSGPVTPTTPTPTASPTPTPTPDTTPPTLISLTAYLEGGTTREAELVDGKWTLSWTVGETVTKIEAIASEPVKLAVSPAVVTMSGESIPEGTEYGTIEVDETDSTKTRLIITPKPGNETAGLEGTFTFTVAAGVVEDDAGNPNAEITITLEVAPDTTSPTLESVSPQPGEVILSSGETFKFTVDAYDAGGLYELEIDHSLEDVFPEFSVYANGNNPYGTAEDKTAFGNLGVTVTYNATEQKWVIDFGERVTNAIISDHQGKITFYIVIKDLAGNEFGSMSPTTSDNTFAYTVKREAEFTFKAADIKNVIGPLHDSTHQWGLWAVRIRPVIEGEYKVIDASTTQEGWGVEAPSSNPWSVYDTNCAWFYDISGAEVAGTPANQLYMIMDVQANTFWSGGFNAAGQWVANWAPGPDGIKGTADDLGTFYSPGYDNGAGGTNVITAVSDLATFTFSFTYTGTWNGQCEFFVDGSKYKLGTANDPGAWVANFFGGYGDGGGLSGNTGSGTGYKIWRSRSIKTYPLIF